MNIITASQGKVFKRIHDGFIFGNEIVLGIDYSTGEPREDKPEYYEEIDIYKPLPDAMPYFIEIPNQFLGVFSEECFIFNEFKIPLETRNEKKCVNLAYFLWQDFRDSLDELLPNGEFRHKALKDILMDLWNYITEQANNQNFIL